uniref:TASOR pseudo-PARP domain-containing protein n=1 Tax=Petromyzon marinus TaxID=7757 RepID=S4RQD2_PETMA
QFNEWRKDMRREGRLEKELDESYGFFLADSERSAKEACQNGLCVGNVKTGCLGTPKMGVYLCSFSDVLQPMQLPIGTGVMLIFKICKKIQIKNIHFKSLLDQLSFEQFFTFSFNPSSQFDCHVSKKLAFVNSSSNNDCFVHKHSQCYLFEFGELDICRRPRQVCPYAMVAFSYEGDGISVPLRDKRHHLPILFSTETKVTPKRHYIVWEGQLMNKGQNLGQVTLKSMQLSVLPIAL